MKRRTRKSVRKHEQNSEAKENIQKPHDFSKLSESLILPRTEKDTFRYAISTSPQGDLLLQLKKDRSRFFKTIIFALLLHLSAVTLFKIVVYIPRSDLQYLDIRIVQTNIDKDYGFDLTSRLKLSKKLENEDGNIEIDINELKQSSSFELPKIEFEELKKLSLRRTLVEEETISTPLLEEYKDSWAQFGVGINRIRETISNLSPFSPSAEVSNKQPDNDSVSPLIRQNIGNGIEIIFRWINPPYNRTILFFPGLLGISKKQVVNEVKDYDFLLTVLPDGTITKVIDLNIVEDEVSKYIGEEIRKIRFEPLINSDIREQQVTIRYRISGALL